MAWPGGKDGAGVYQRLINQIPPHDVFVSAFLGDCAILRRKLPAAVSIGIDRSRANIDRWSQSQHGIPGLRLYCCCGIAWLQHAFDLHLVGPQDQGTGDRGQGSANGSHSAEAAESGGSKGKPRRRSLPGRPVRAAQSGGVRSPTPCPLSPGSCLLARSFVYLDPPYLIESRRSRRAIYDHELTDNQHAELLDTALRLPCPVMISHYPHPLYERTLAAWRTFCFTAQTRGGRPATEQVWCNYPEPAELHDPRFVGGDKRERERVRRRVRNWTDGLARMLPAERQAVLDAIAAKWIAGTTSREVATLPAN